MPKKPVREPHQSIGVFRASKIRLERSLHCFKHCKLTLNSTFWYVERAWIPGVIIGNSLLCTAAKFNARVMIAIVF